MAILPENSAEWPDAPGMPNAITFRSQATVRVSSSRPRHQLKVMNNDLMLAVVVAMFGAVQRPEQMTKLGRDNR